MNQLEELQKMGLAGIRADRIEGREFVSGTKRYIDFCSTNYLGFDYENSLHERGFAYAKEWGSLTGWSRLEADPVIYSGLETRLKNWLGCKDVILAHTITKTNFSVMSALAQKGLMICDEKVHTVVWESCRLARDHGAKLTKFKHQDTADLERILKENEAVHPKIVAVDGVYSISGAYAPIAKLQELCTQYGAWLYVDDAHGFGVLGKNPTPQNPYGQGGAGILEYAKGNHQRTFYVSSFGKAFCTHSAFITVPHEYSGSLRENCLQYIYSAPMNPYTIGTVDASLDLNLKIGEARRKDIRELCHHFTEGLQSLGLRFQNNAQFPVVFWEVGSLDDLIVTAKKLYGQGVIAGLRAYPVVPAHSCGFRFGITALHTKAQLDRTLAVIESMGALKKAA